MSKFITTLGDDGTTVSEWKVEIPTTELPLDSVNIPTCWIDPNDLSNNGKLIDTSTSWGPICNCNKNKKISVKIHRINKDNPLPVQANKGDAGYDVYAAEEVTFLPEEIKLVPLGIIAQAPYGYHFKLCIRSSMAYKKGFDHPNAPGVIDHAFAGPKDEIKMILKAPKETEKYIQPFVIKSGERIGQLILEKNNEIEWDEQEDRNFAGADRGGIGSSDIKLGSV